MQEPIKSILERNHLTLSQISDASGITTSTLSSAFDRPVQSWSIKILNGAAKGLHMRPSDLLILLQHDSYKLDIDDGTQTIQGVHITDMAEYRTVKFAVINEELEGWQPSREDILRLVDAARNPDPEIAADYRRIFTTQNNTVKSKPTDR
jgi:lambda repressor-like predicted transcriptional regulator